MQSPKINSISIKLRNFGKTNKILLFVLLLFIFLMGIIGFFWNWKNGLCSISIIALMYILLRNNIFKISIIIFFIIVMISGFSFFFHLNFIEILLTTICLSFSLFLKPTYEQIKIDNKFEIFFLNNKELRCLVTEDNDYKGYVLTPKTYLKTYPTNSIKAFSFKGSYLIISIGDKIIRPRELTIENIQEINLFVKYNYPHFLGNEVIFKENLKIESKLYINKFLVLSPLIIFSFAIYFFADNGRNTSLTFVFFYINVCLNIYNL